MAELNGIERVVAIVDLANVMGSRPDGWWKDRAGAATTLLDGTRALRGRQVTTPDGRHVILEQIVVVVEGQAKNVAAPVEIIVVRAPRDGDSAIVQSAHEYVGLRSNVLVITADRGLKARLPDEVSTIGPNWWNTLLGR